jgi:hypothetical protein
MYEDVQQQFQQLGEIQKEAGVNFEDMLYFDGRLSPLSTTIQVSC